MGAQVIKKNHVAPASTSSYKLPQLWSEFPQAKVLAVPLLNRFDVAISLLYSAPRRTIPGCLRLCR
jgi:hypothetical protein